MNFLQNRFSFLRGFPKGTFIISSTFTLYNISLGVIYALLVLYLEHVLLLSRSQAYLIWGTFFVLFFCGSLLGGYLGTRYDHYSAIVVGLVLTVIGCFILATADKELLYYGLGAFIIGSGLFVPNALYYLGQLFCPTSNYRDSAFTICFVLSNVGVFIAASCGGLLAGVLDYNLVFLLGGLSVVLALLIYLNLGLNSKILTLEFNRKNLITLFLIGLFLCLFAGIVLRTALYSDLVLLVVSLILLIFLSRLVLKMDKDVRGKFLICIAMLLLSTSFWVLAAMSPSVITLFVEHNVNRHIFGMLIPTATFYSLVSFFTILFAPLLSYLWLKLNKVNRDISIAAKLGIGIIFMGLAYLILVPGIHYASLGYIASVWVIVSYLLQTLGEIFTAPITQSMVGRLVPKNYEAFMLGVRDFTIGISGVIGGFLAYRFAPSATISQGPIITNKIFSQDFMFFGATTLLVGMVTVLLVIIRHYYKKHQLLAAKY